MTDVERVCFSNGGQYLAVDPSGDIIKLLNSQTLALLWATEPSHSKNNWFIDMQFSSDDRSLVVATNNTIRSFNIITTTIDIDYVSTPKPVLSHDAKFIAWVYDLNLIKVVNLETKEEVIKVSLALQQAFCYGFSNTDNPSFVVYLGKNVGVQIWELEKGSVLRVPFRPPLSDSYKELDVYNIPKRPTLSSNGRQIIFIDRDHDPSYIWDFHDNSLITLEGYELIQKCTVTPKGDCVVIHTHNKLILYHMNGNELHCGKTDDVVGAVFSKDGKRLAISGSRGKYLDILELDGWQNCSTHLYHPTSTPRYLPPTAVSPDGKYFFIHFVEKGYYEICDVNPFESCTLSQQDLWLSIHPQHHERFRLKAGISVMSRMMDLSKYMMLK